jgi:8-oxo-dGTP diphosphatase
MKLFVGMKAVIVQDGKVLILREAEYDEGTNAGKWDVPGGRINPEEPFMEGLRREVREESGLEIEPLEIWGIFETFPTIKGESCHIIRIYHLCRPVTADIQLSGDHSEYAWLDPKDIHTKEFVSDIVEMIEKVGSESK